MRKAGLESEWLEGNSIKKRINSPAVLAGIRVPYTCSLHPPTKLMQGLAHAAHQEGAKISEKTRVIHAKNNKLITTKGTVIADKIVIATEGYTPRGWMPYHLHTRQDTALATKPLPKKWFEKHWKGNELLWNYGVHYCAFKKSPDGRVYLFASEGARKGFAEFFPDTKISATHKWNCRVAGYKDQLPRIGKHPGMKNTYFGSGYRGHGLVYGFLAGKIITDLITGRKNKNAQLFKP
jgi:glycine/D-amino acid oxidase-like deaminating enzyme